MFFGVSRYLAPSTIVLVVCFVSCNAYGLRGLGWSWCWFGGFVLAISLRGLVGVVAICFV